jgi:hypothetical protein
MASGRAVVADAIAILEPMFERGRDLRAAA